MFFINLNELGQGLSEVMITSSFMYGKLLPWAALGASIKGNGHQTNVLVQNMTK